MSEHTLLCKVDWPFVRGVGPHEMSREFGHWAAFHLDSSDVKAWLGRLEEIRAAEEQLGVRAGRVVLSGSDLLHERLLFLRRPGHERALLDREPPRFGEFWPLEVGPEVVEEAEEVREVRMDTRELAFQWVAWSRYTWQGRSDVYVSVGGTDLPEMLERLSWYETEMSELRETFAALVDVWIEPDDPMDGVPESDLQTLHALLVAATQGLRPYVGDGEERDLLEAPGEEALKRLWGWAEEQEPYLWTAGGKEDSIREMTRQVRERRGLS